MEAYGRVWTAEGNEVVVRRATDGKELGVFNEEVAGQFGEHDRQLCAGGRQLGRSSQ